MYYVYVLKSISYKKSYVGSTSNIERRLEEHNRGRTRYTAKFMPWELIYTEEFNILKEARDREKYLKSKSGRKFLKEVVFKNH